MTNALLSSYNNDNESTSNSIDREKNSEADEKAK
jgi:hypothetical protein